MRRLRLYLEMKRLPYIGLGAGMILSFGVFYLLQNTPQEMSAYAVLVSLIALSVVAFLYLRQLMQHVEMCKAQEVERLKSDFMATMSHEIRTPMNGILGMAELALGANVSPQIDGYMHTIINSSETLMNIINDILDFSKIEAGKMTLDPRAIDMVELVDDVARLYSVQARDKAIELVVHYVPSTPRFVYADPVRMRQILGNLINNAIKFTPYGHVTLTIDACRDEQRTPSTDTVNTEDSAILRFSVTDTGIGIAPEAQPAIFDKFSQAAMQQDAQRSGTGLGLSICKSLVQLMGGEIGVDSTVGQGSTFWFKIAAPHDHKAAAPQRQNDIQGEIQSLENLRVLVVDDLATIRQVVSDQLNLAGMHCDVTDSGNKALLMMQEALNQQDPYQIVLIDYLMPHMDGEMLARAINDITGLRDSCLIMLTSAGAPFADEQFAARGFSAYIAKPIARDALLKNIAFVWDKYNHGQKDGLIHVDAGSNHKDDYEQKSEPKITGKHVLVAEDNLVNQVFIKEILEEMGARYHVVSNGKAAVGYVRQNPSLDLVIMDCLMPEMDGYEATRRICMAKETGEVRADLPILALTANAMKGDRERCLDVGMCDFLTKPVRKKQLKDAIYSWVIGAGEDPMAQESPMGYQDEAVTDTLIDFEEIKRAKAVLKDQYEHMVSVYFETSKERIHEMRTGLKCGDLTLLIRAAHSLKSSSRQMGALKLSQSAMHIENCAKQCETGAHELSQKREEIIVEIRQIERTLRLTEDAFESMAA